MKKNIPICVLCPMEACTRSNTCARHARYLKALAESDVMEVMNPAVLGISTASCPYHLTAQKQRWAKGFSRLYASIPRGNARYFYTATPYPTRSFYKAKNGEMLINPEMQSLLLDIFRCHGADMTIDFDAYVEQDVLVEE